MEPDRAVAILDKATELMQVPHAVVPAFDEFILNAEGEPVEYGDPAACRFCMSGLLTHADVVIRGAAENDRLTYEDEEKLVHGPNYEHDPYQGSAAIAVFSECWQIGPNLKDVRQAMLDRLAEMRARWV